MGSINKGLFSSNSNEWATPQDLFDILDREFHFNLDPCANAKNTKCRNYFNVKQNGLIRKWEGSVFMNPPYGRVIGGWIEKAFEESLETYCRVVVCLIPARTDARYWHRFCMRAHEIRFIEGRVSFSGLGPAPFPSAIVIFNKKGKDRCFDFSPLVSSFSYKGE